MMTTLLHLPFRFCQWLTKNIRPMERPRPIYQVMVVNTAAPPSAATAVGTAEGITAPPRPTNRFGRELVGISLFLLAFFAALDVVVGRWLWKPVVDDQLVEPCSPMMLQLKLDALGRHSGYRVALIGDSVILGLCLKDHGDPNWKEHTLASVLQKRFDTEFPDANVLVVNLGLNGALPCDLALVAEQLKNAKPDLVIADIGLRAFSSETP